MATSNTTDQAINDRIISDIIKREGGYVNDPHDRGSETVYGISKRSNPEAWALGPPSLEKAIEIYRRKYLENPGFGKIEDPRLRAHLVDYGVLSGPALAIQKLQALVGAEIDGVLGPLTLAKVNAHPEPLRLNNQLALERAKMVGRIVQRDPKQSRFLAGWLNRIFEFIHL